MRPLATVVLHRERLVAEALAAALDRSPGVVVVGTSMPLRSDAVDTAVIDTTLPHADRTAARLRRDGVRVVALGGPLASADAHVTADRPVGDLARAIVPGGVPGVGRLSAREREVLSLAGRGLAGKQIARLLGISHKTVEHHKTRAFAKLGVPNQAAAVAALLEEGRWIRPAI